MPTSTELRGQAEVPKIEPQIEFSVGIFSYERVKHLNFTVRRSGAILPRNPPRTFHQQLLFCSVASPAPPVLAARESHDPHLLACAGMAVNIHPIDLDHAEAQCSERSVYLASLAWCRAGGRHPGTLSPEDLASPCDSADARRCSGTASRRRANVSLTVRAEREPFVSCGHSGAAGRAALQPVTRSRPWTGFARRKGVTGCQ